MDKIYLLIAGVILVGGFVGSRKLSTILHAERQSLSNAMNPNREERMAKVPVLPERVPTPKAVHTVYDGARVYQAGSTAVYPNRSAARVTE